MEEASSRQARLRALRERANESQGPSVSGQEPPAQRLPQPLLADPFSAGPPQPVPPRGAFNFYSNPLAAYSDLHPGSLPPSTNVVPRSQLTAPPLAPGTSWRAPPQGPGFGSQGLLPGPPPGPPPGWQQGQAANHGVGHRPSGNSQGGWGFGRGHDSRGSAFAGRGASAGFGRGGGGAGPADYGPAGSQRRWEGGSPGGQSLSRGPKAPRFDGGGRGSGGKRGREEGLSARTHPELFFHKSMLEDPWADLERAHARRPAVQSGGDESWLPPSLHHADKGAVGQEVRVASGSSLARALAGALDVAHNVA